VIKIINIIVRQLSADDADWLMEMYKVKIGNKSKMHAITLCAPSGYQSGHNAKHDQQQNRH